MLDLRWDPGAQRKWEYAHVFITPRALLAQRASRAAATALRLRGPRRGPCGAVVHEVDIYALRIYFYDYEARVHPQETVDKVVAASPGCSAFAAPSARKTQLSSTATLS